MRTLLLLGTLLALAAPRAATASAVFTNNTVISSVETDYDGMDIVVSNCTVAVDGPHTFASVRVAGTGVLTHSASTNGTIPVVYPISDEPQILTDTNAVTLATSNIIASSVVVKDIGGSVTYSNTLDYVLTVQGALTLLGRTSTSSIPDGSTVLVNYNYSTNTIITRLILVVAGDMEVEPGAAIDGDGRGFLFNSGTGHGFSSGFPASGGGGGHGGAGGASSGGAAGGASTIFDSPLQPSQLGASGGDGTGGTGGRGGGRILLTIGGEFRMNGIVSANADDATNSRAGGGAGGTISVNAHAFTGAGSITANGGNGEPIHGGGGGGGMIAIHAGTNNFTGTFLAAGGSGWVAGGAGTIYLQSTNPASARLIVDNNGRSGATTATPFAFFDLTVKGGARTWVIPSPPETLRDLFVGSNSYIFLTNAVTLNASNVTIQSGSGIIGDGNGSSPNSGSGSGSVVSGNGTGATHGGRGGQVLPIGSTPFGNPVAPTFIGGGGGAPTTSSGGWGGGAIRLNVTGALMLDGAISVNATHGTNGADPDNAGGAGGSIYITTSALSGAGSLSANGGNGFGGGGGGGGGRVAVYFDTNTFTGPIRALGGVNGTTFSYPCGGAGTVYLKKNSDSAGLLIVDNGGNKGLDTGIATLPTSDLTLVNGGFISGVLPTIRNFFIGSNSLVTLLNGTSPITVSGNATIEAGGVMHANAGNPGTGSGAGGNANFQTGAGGGGHGGYGGSGLTANGGIVHDSVTAPSTYGGNGGASSLDSITSSFGGGVVLLNVGGSLLLNGSLAVNGGSAVRTNAGGGAGGSVRLTLGSFAGSGNISANGGSGVNAGSGGGGGRIAITFNSNTFTGTISNLGGAGFHAGGAGTTYLRSNSANFGRLFVNNGGLAGTNTSWLSGGLQTTVDLLVTNAGALFWNESQQSLRNLTVASNGSFIMSVQPLTAQNAVVEAGGAITADGTGNGPGLGTGAGSTFTVIVPKSGGGYGGFGSRVSGTTGSSGASYGSITAPIDAGSGGGNGSGSSGLAPFGGAGGGIARLTVNGSLTVNGRISADGKPGSANSGGGSGGTVRLTVGTLAGSGTISANAGAGGTGNAGGGGGGRIAIQYTSNLFTGGMSAYGGPGGPVGGAGTIYLKPAFNPVGQIIVDNGGQLGTNTPVPSMLTNNLTIKAGATVQPADTFLMVSNLVLDNFGFLTSAAVHTNLDLTVLGNATVNSGSAISVNGRGFAPGAGPGAGQSTNGIGAGGGYGGAGSASASGAAGGVTYGSAQQPIDRGSGGGLGNGPLYSGSQGGGAIRLNVKGTLAMEGRLSADGNSGLQDDSGGGAGGSIWASVGTLAGNGQITADGGDGELYNGGGGGAGRIALYYNTNQFTGLVSALGGDGGIGGAAGSIFESTNVPLLILSHTPVGIVSSAVSSIDVLFNGAPDPALFSGEDLSLDTPNGPLDPGGVTVAPLSSSRYRITFPQYTAVGDYTFTVGPDLADLFGQAISQVYTGAFTVSLPYVQGAVTDTNGQPIAGVAVQFVNSLLSPTTTDTNGNYRLGFVAPNTATVVPSLTGLLFVPGSRSYTNAFVTISNQNYVAVTSLVPTLTSQLQETNMALSWYGIPGATYQAFSSTNLLDWLPYGAAFQGSNTAVQIFIPVDPDPQKYFRVRANN